jgi:hypothetical protein
MTTSLFKITPTNPTALTIEAGKDGTFSFTVESLAAPDKTISVLLQAQRIGEDRKGQDVDWLVASPATLSITGGETATVTLKARPVTATPRGPHSLKLVIADKDHPNDSYAETPSVACQVIGPPIVVKDDKKKFPLWLIVAIVGGVVLIGGGVLAFVLLRGGDDPPELGEACAASSPACVTGLVCAHSKCALPAGATCIAATAGQCASSECAGTLCTIPHGDRCEPSTKDTIPCPANTACDPTARLCLGHVGASCTAAADCETGECAAGKCVTKAPAVKPGDPCDTTCPAPLTCGSTHRCVGANGTACTNNNQCSSGLCNAGVCADPPVGRECTVDGICGVDQQCTPLQPNLKHCTWKPGHSCGGNGECSSQWCNGGTCSRDDGKCDGPRDCPDPFLCILAKHQCLLASNMPCGGHNQCDSGFCNPRSNRCRPIPCAPPCAARSRCNLDPDHPACVPIFILPLPTVPIFKVPRHL